MPEVTPHTASKTHGLTVDRCSRPPGTPVVVLSRFDEDERVLMAVEAEVRQLVRRRGLDPVQDRLVMRRLIDEGCSTTRSGR